MNTGRARFRKWRGPLGILAKIMKITPPVAKTVLETLPGSGPLALALRYAALKALAKECGDNVYIDSYVKFKNIDRLVIGTNVSIHSYVYIDAQGGIEIGDNVSIAHASTVISAEHGWDDPQTPIKYNAVRLLKTIIREDVWIGCGARILAGTNVERRVIIAAGAVTKGQLKTGSIYGGVPARKISDILN